MNSACRVQHTIYSLVPARRVTEAQIHYTERMFPTFAVILSVIGAQSGKTSRFDSEQSWLAINQKFDS